MSYCNVNDLTRWIESSELAALCTQIEGATPADPEVQAVAGEAIRAADAEMDSFLLGRWPGLRNVNPVPPELTALSARIAVYNLYLRRRAVSAHWRTVYEDCRRRLEQAAAGGLSLGLDELGAVAESSGKAWRTDTEEGNRVYTDEKLRKF